LWIFIPTEKIGSPLSICKPDIFKSIFDRNVDRLQRYLISRGLNVADAADVVQESFVRLWQQCKEVELKGAPAYLTTICNRLIIDRHRSQQVVLRYKNQKLRTDKIVSEDPQFALESQEFKERLEAAIASMPEKSKEVFLMHRFNDMSYKEIAETLSLSVKAIEKRMHKALKHLTDAHILQKK